MKTNQPVDSQEPLEPDFDLFQDQMEPLSGYSRHIAFSPDFVDITNSIPAALMLSQAVFWQKVSIEKWHRVWWFKTYAEWMEETRMTKDQLDLARKKLSRFMETELRGIPAKLYYRLKPEAIREALKARSRSTHQPGSGQVTSQYVGFPRTSKEESTLESTEKGSRVRAKAPPKTPSDDARQFVNAFRERHEWYPRLLDPRQTVRELSAAEFLLASSTQSEIFSLIDRVLAGFRGNRRKVATVSDLWENFAALRVEFSERSGLTAEESARIAQISYDAKHQKTDEEMAHEWQEYLDYCKEVGKQPDESAKPDCLKAPKMPQDVDPHGAGYESIEPGKL